MTVPTDSSTVWASLRKQLPLIVDAETALHTPHVFDHLPGRSAQWRMATSFRMADPTPERLLTVRKSAVLLLLQSSHTNGRAMSPDDITIILTLRREDLKHHGGQISFPGGRIESGETIAQAALREAEEEIGIAPQTVTLLGSLTPLYVPVSNNYIFPLVGYIPPGISFLHQEEEVAEIFATPIIHLLDTDAIKRQTRVIQGYEIDMPYWDIHPTTPLWGATAMIISEFLALFDGSQRHV